MLSSAAREALRELVGSDDPTIVGLVLGGSAARGMATERSDVDVYVVRATMWSGRPATARPSTRSTGRWRTSSRWTSTPLVGSTSGGRSPTRRCSGTRTGERITEAVRRQATVDDDEQRWVLIDQDRLDGYVNFAYRSLKNDRDGRLLEARLDAGESVSWLLDPMFSLAGRLGPYNKYLPWELQPHPLSAPEWSVESFLPELERMLAGDAAAIRRAFAVVDREVRAWDVAHDTTVCGDAVDSWGGELESLLRGVGDRSHAGLPR